MSIPGYRNVLAFHRSILASYGAQHIEDKLAMCFSNWMPLSACLGWLERDVVPKLAETDNIERVGQISEALIIDLAMRQGGSKDFDRRVEFSFASDRCYYLDIWDTHRRLLAHLMFRRKGEVKALLSALFDKYCPPFEVLGEELPVHEVELIPIKLKQEIRRNIELEL